MLLDVIGWIGVEVDWDSEMGCEVGWMKWNRFGWDYVDYCGVGMMWGALGWGGNTRRKLAHVARAILSWGRHRRCSVRLGRWVDPEGPAESATCTELLLVAGPSRAGGTNSGNKWFANLTIKSKRLPVPWSPCFLQLSSKSIMLMRSNSFLLGAEAIATAVEI